MERYKELSTYWDETVKPLIKKYINADALAFYATITKTPKREERVQLNNTCTDATSMFFLSRFAAAMEHDLADDSAYGMSANLLLQIKDTLHDESYWKNVWHDKQNEERQDLEKIKEVLPILRDLIIETMKEKA